MERFLTLLTATFLPISVAYAGGGDPAPIIDPSGVRTDLKTSAIAATSNSGDGILASVEGNSLYLHTITSSGAVKGDPLLASDQASSSVGAVALSGNRQATALLAWVNTNAKQLTLSWRKDTLAESFSAVVPIQDNTRFINNPSLARGSSDRSLVCWVESASLGLDIESDSKLWFQAFKGNTPLGSATSIPVARTGASPAVVTAAPDNGQYSIAWTEFSGNIDTARLMLWRVDPEGNGIGSPIVVRPEGSRVMQPAILSVESGITSIAYVEKSEIEGVPGGDIMLRHYSSAGVELPGASDIAATTDDHYCLFPMLVADGDDSFVAAWTSFPRVEDSFPIPGDLELQARHFIDYDNFDGSPFPLGSGVSSNFFGNPAALYLDADHNFQVALTLLDVSGAGTDQVELRKWRPATWNRQRERLPHPEDTPEHLGVNPAVVATQSGGFVVGWTCISPEGEAESIKLRSYAEDLSPTTPAIAIDGGSAGKTLQLARNSGGEILAVWNRQSSNPADEGTFARILNPNLTPITPVIKLNNGSIFDSSLALLDDGRAVIVFDGSTPGRTFVLLSENGVVLQSGQIKPSSPSDVSTAKIETLEGGGWVVVWEDHADPMRSIGFQVYDDNAAPVAAAEQIPTPATNLSHDCVRLADGSLRIVWTWQDSASNDRFIALRTLGPDGRFIPGALTTSIGTPSLLSPIQAIALSDGTFVVAGNKDYLKFDTQNRALGDAANLTANLFHSDRTSIAPLGDSGLIAAMEDNDVFFLYPLDSISAHARIFGDVDRIVKLGPGLTKPIAAGLAGAGGIAVAWTGPTAQGGSELSYKVIGHHELPEFLASSESELTLTSLLPRPDGKTAAVWIEEEPDGTVNLHRRVFDPYSSIRFAVTTAFARNLPPGSSATTLEFDDGRSLLSWTDGTNLSAHILSSNGVVSSSHLIATAGEGYTISKPVSASFADGSFMIAWHRRISNQHEVFAQVFDASGNPAGLLRRPLFTRVDVVMELKLASNGGDSALLAYRLAFDPSIFSQCLHKDPIRIGLRHVVAEGGFSYLPKELNLQSVPGGGYVIAYARQQLSDASKADIFYHTLDALGRLTNSLQSIANLDRNGPQNHPAIAFSEFGNGVIVWSGQRFNSQGSHGIAMRDFLGPGIESPGPFAAFAHSSGISLQPEGDDDGDGVNNAAEFITGSDPSDPDSIPAPLRFEVEADGTMRVTQRYRLGIQALARTLLETSTDLKLWEPIAPPTLISQEFSPDANGTRAWDLNLGNLGASTDPSEFWRLKFRLAPED